MFLNNKSPIAGGRELWGFPKKLGNPSLKVEKDTFDQHAHDYGSMRVATGTMGYEHRTLNASQIEAAMGAPNFLIKIIPHVDGTARVCGALNLLPRRHEGPRRLGGPWLVTA